MSGLLGSKKVLICCTGSVATIKLPVLVDEIRKLNKQIEIKVVVTKYAKYFLSTLTERGCIDEVELYDDDNEWSLWKQRGDPVLHIDLAKWADVLLIAPLDANTLAKIANGICDNLVTCAVRAWDIKKPLLFCPAMNTKMWEHPITEPQIGTLVNWGYTLVPCTSKTLICGDTGLGAMAEVPTIVQFLSDKLNA